MTTSLPGNKVRILSCKINCGYCVGGAASGNDLLTASRASLVARLVTNLTNYTAKSAAMFLVAVACRE